MKLMMSHSLISVPIILLEVVEVGVDNVLFILVKNGATRTFHVLKSTSSYARNQQTSNHHRLNVGCVSKYTASLLSKLENDKLK